MAESTQNNAPPDPSLIKVLDALKRHAWLIAVLFGVLFIIAIIILAIAFPKPTSFQYLVFRVVLSLAAAGVAAVIPGMIKIKAEPNTKFFIHAGGAVAVFLIVYALSPAGLLANPKEETTSVPKLLLDNVDDSQGDDYVISLTPSKRVHLARLVNPSDGQIRIEVAKFPENFLYTSLSHESTLIKPQEERQFSVVFIQAFPNASDYFFNIKNDKNQEFHINVKMEGNWQKHYQELSQAFNQKLSQLKNATPKQIYLVAQAITYSDYGSVESGIDKALIAHFLLSEQQIQAAAYAYAQAEQSNPGIVKQMAGQAPTEVMVALADIHAADNQYRQATDWYNTAALLGNADARYALAQLYETGRSVQADTGAKQGHIEAVQKLDGGVAPVQPSPQTQLGLNVIPQDVLKFLRQKGNCPHCILPKLSVILAKIPIDSMDKAVVENRLVLAKYKRNSKGNYSHFSKEITYFLAMFQYSTKDTANFLLVEIEEAVEGLDLLVLTDDNLRWADLRWIDLRWADLQGANFQVADLQEANLQGANLQGANLQGADLQVANLLGADLQGANLQEGNFRWADLEKADLEKANFTNAKISKYQLSMAKNYNKAILKNLNPP
ncbi:pentapeptide repeat-containing protein [Methylovulum psychrotolerans]|nr:pentapeptide repeat-containing protein [Methylovulum psychrotolerans]